MLAAMEQVTHTVELRIAADHPSLPGHFPGRPLVPGVVLLERVLAAIEKQHAPLAALRLPQVKFARSLLPEQTARIEWRAADASSSRWRFRILRNDELIASGEVACA